jgi:hypothetical protein
MVLQVVTCLNSVRWFSLLSGTALKSFHSQSELFGLMWSKHFGTLEKTVSGEFWQLIALFAPQQNLHVVVAFLNS